MHILIKTASIKYELEKLFIDAIESNDETLNGALQDLNSALGRYQNDPYKTPEEVKEYNQEEYQRLITKTKHRVNWMLDHMSFGPNGVRVYRALSVKDTDEFVNSLLNNTMNVGKYWSFDKRKAKAYWGKSHLDTVVLYGELPIASIDILGTINANTILLLSQDEDEITAIPNTEVLIASIDVKNDNIPINKMHKI